MANLVTPADKLALIIRREFALNPAFRAALRAKLVTRAAA